MREKKKEKKVYFLSVRFDATEYTRLVQKAKASRHETLAAYIRDLVRYDV